MPRIEKVDGRTLRRNGAPATTGLVTPQHALQLQRLAGNQVVTKLLPGAHRGGSAVVQRYAEYELAQKGAKSPHVNFLFDRRRDDGTATTGVHNYAYVNQTGVWARSAQNRHAEMKLLLQLYPDEGDEIEIISELRPCAYCEQDMKDYETDHGVTIKVFYLLEYLATGDGNPNEVRAFYKARKKLTGGGLWAWQVAS